MRRADRLLRLIQILRRHRHPVTGAKIAAELEVSTRTVYRDILDLMTDGVPIRGEAGIGYVLEAGYDLPPLMFTATEIEAIVLGLRWVARRADPELGLAAQDASAKVSAVLPEALRPLLLDAALLVRPAQNLLPDRVDVAALRRAVRTSHKVDIAYRDEAGSQSLRVIWPIALVYFDTQRLLIAWCELRNGFRSFRTDRMETATVLPDRYPQPRANLLRQWIAEQGRNGSGPTLEILM